MAAFNREALVNRHSRKPSEWIEFTIKALEKGLTPTTKVKFKEGNYYLTNADTGENFACLGGLVMLEALKAKRKKSTKELFALLHDSLSNPLETSYLECAIDSLRLGQIKYFLFFLGHQKSIAEGLSWSYTPLEQHPKLFFQRAKRLIESLKEKNL